MILLSSHFLRKRKLVLASSKSWNIEDGEFPLLIKEQRDYHRPFKVYFRMSVAQFDALPAILEPHFKKTTNFCELSVQGSIYSALCCEMKWMNLTLTITWIWAFACMVALNCQKWTQNACHDAKKQKNLIRIFLWWTEIQQCVNDDWQNVRSYLFSTCNISDENFGLVSLG